MRIYLDSAPIIYLVEGVVPYSGIVESHLVQREAVQICSDLSRLECRAQPIRDGLVPLLAAFDRYFADVVGEVIPLSRLVIDRATELRARYGIPTPDAIHLAAAIEGECDSFLTNDRRLRRCADIAVEVLGDSQPVGGATT